MTSAVPSVTPSSDVPFLGFVETTGDALRLVQAARQGLIPRITRRLNDEERGRIVCSGSIFIFSVEESGIKRWTEGLSWSASRIAGNFLMYRELLSRNGGRTSYTGRALSTESAFSRRRLVPRDTENQPTFKVNGLIKKTITISADGTQYHLISYYSDEDIRARRLQRPSNRPDIMALGIPQDLLEATSFRYPPRVEVGHHGNVVNIRDADEIDAFQMSDLPSYPPRNRDPSPSLRSLNGIKAEPSDPVLRGTRSPRAIRPAKPATFINTQAADKSLEYTHSDMYASPIDTEDYGNFTYPSHPHSLHDTASSPTTSSYSDTSGEGSTTSHWQNAPTGPNFVTMDERYGNQASMGQYGMDNGPASAPLTSNFAFAEAAYSPRDMTRTYSYPPATSSPYAEDHSAYYYTQQVQYSQQLHSISYPTEYDPRYSAPVYYEPYNNGQEHQ